MRIGAAIQGLTIGLLIGFVIVPLRMGYMDVAVFDPGLSPAMSSLSFLPALLLLIDHPPRRAAEDAGALDLSARLSPRHAAEGAR